MKDKHGKNITLKEVHEQGYDSDSYINPKLIYQLDDRFGLKSPNKKLKDAESPLEVVNEGFIIGFELIVNKMIPLDDDSIRSIEDHSNMSSINRNLLFDKQHQSMGLTRLLFTWYGLRYLGYDVKTPKQLKRFMDNNGLNYKNSMIHEGTFEEVVGGSTKQKIRRNKNQNLADLEEQIFYQSPFESWLMNLLEILQVQMRTVKSYGPLMEILGGHYWS